VRVYKGGKVIRKGKLPFQERNGKVPLKDHLRGNFAVGCCSTVSKEKKTVVGGYQEDRVGAL